jgi:hypothetical protein
MSDQSRRRARASKSRSLEVLMPLGRDARRRWRGYHSGPYSGAAGARGLTVGMKAGTADRRSAGRWSFYFSKSRKRCRARNHEPTRPARKTHGAEIVELRKLRPSLRDLAGFLTLTQDGATPSWAILATSLRDVSREALSSPGQGNDRDSGDVSRRAKH